MLRLNRKDRDTRLALFKGLYEKQINTLYNLATIKKLQLVDILFKEGDIDQTLYVVLSGKLKVEKGQNGKKDRLNKSSQEIV